MAGPDRKEAGHGNGRPPARSLPAAPVGTGPVPRGVPGPERIVEVDGLLITVLPGGELALVDSHPDGATSVISLGVRRMEALAPLLGKDRPDSDPGEPRREDAPAEDTAPAEAAPDHRSVPLDRATGTDGQTGSAEEVDWNLYDEQLKAAFLLEQYARGVAPEDLPPGWEAVLKLLPAALTRRSRRTRDSGPEASKGLTPGEP